MTYGILEESIRVLVQFMLGAGYVLSVTILEGRTGRGVPIGVMAIDDAGPGGAAGGWMGRLVDDVRPKPLYLL